MRLEASIVRGHGVVHIGPPEGNTSGRRPTPAATGGRRPEREPPPRPPGAEGATRGSPLLGRAAARSGTGRSAGAILIVALGVLALLAILGATFASLMRLEKLAADNYVDAQRMDMLTASALDKVIAELQDAENRRSWTFYHKDHPWLFLIKEENDLGHGRVGVESPLVGNWVTYSELSGQRYRFKTKIIDCAAQINLNGPQDTLARMLDSLGEAIEKSPRLKFELRGEKRRHVVTNPFYTKPNRGGSRVRGRDVLLFRQRLEGRQFRSKIQLKQLIGHENYQLVKDFVTCYSWQDPYTYAPADGLDEVPDLALGGLRGGAGGGGGTTLGGGRVKSLPSVHGPERLVQEPRYPININTAPEEVLIACIQGIAGRRAFPYANLGVAGGAMALVDQSATIEGPRIANFGAQEEVGPVGPRPVWVFSQQLQYPEAQKLAQRIISQRKDPRRAFRAWRTNDPSQPGFEDFIDELDESFFPSPSTVVVMDPDQPTNRQIWNAITGGSVDPFGISRMWQRGNAQGMERTIRRQLSLSVHNQHAWYYDMMKSILKANFNPNTRLNRNNPNAPAFIPVNKADLVWARGRSGEELFKGYTTEFCFEPMGYFEITTLGEMVDAVRTDRLRASRSRTRLAAAGLPEDEVFSFRRKMRAVVQIYDVLRHTSQLHFEKTFQVRTRSSRQDRKYVVTWPEPMQALTELYTQGSPRDGRVELAGLLDGQRMQTPYTNRESVYGRSPAVLMELPFLDRDQQSIAKLRQQLRGSGASIMGSDIDDVLEDALDARHSRSRSTLRRAYRVRELQGLGLFSNTTGFRYNQPRVTRELLGNDLMPDGFHSSLFRHGHLGSRMVVLPARTRIEEDMVSPGRKVGASGRPRGEGAFAPNLVGNVPYTSGGIAFWMKFEFDGADPVFSGLIGCTEVIEPVKSAGDLASSEGVQFFIFKNTIGQLRFVRVYYHQAFPEEGGATLWPIVEGATGTDDEETGENPMLEYLDRQKLVARVDFMVDVRHWRAHEWHHIAMDWDDKMPNRPLRVYVDFADVREFRPVVPHPIYEVPSVWTRLNERNPKDGLQVGGIVRNQGDPDSGIFKWYTNVLDGVVLPGPQQFVKRLVANATIDDLITYEGTFMAVKSYYGSLPGYFTNLTGEYANVFEIPIPPDVDHVVLRTLDWTSYYPATYTDSLPGSQAQRLQVTPISCEVDYNSPQTKPAAFQEPWRRPTVDNPIAGRLAFREGGGIKGRSAQFVYKFRLSGGRPPVGSTAGGVVQTPAVDDVTLTYFLPSPRILIQEEVD